MPVLVGCDAGSADGYMPSGGSAAAIRRLAPSLVENLKTAQGWQDLERQYGAIAKSEWSRLQKLLTLVERFSAGDGSPIITFDENEKKAVLDRLDAHRWLQDKPGLYRAIGGGDGLMLALEGLKIVHPGKSPPERSERDNAQRLTLTATVKTPAFAISEALTRGLIRARFVIWWAQKERKLAPGLYCPDMPTALYALVLSGLGTPGGVAVCQRCMTPFIRSKGVQLYCSHRCQVAAGMQRYRNLKRQRAGKAKSGAKKRTAPKE